MPRKFEFIEGTPICPDCGRVAREIDLFTSKDYLCDYCEDKNNDLSAVPVHIEFEKTQPYDYGGIYLPDTDELSYDIFGIRPNEVYTLNPSSGEYINDFGETLSEHYNPIVTECKNPCLEIDLADEEFVKNKFYKALKLPLPVQFIDIEIPLAVDKTYEKK